MMTYTETPFEPIHWLVQQEIKETGAQAEELKQ